MRTLFAGIKHFYLKNFRLKFFLFIFLIPVLKLQAQVTIRAPGSRERHAAIKNWDGFEFRKSWKYYEGDNRQWGSVNWNDTDWKEIKPDSANPLSVSNVTGFKGIGWFRMYFEIDSSMMNIPLFMSVSQYGAMEVYLDGKFLHSFGLVGKEKPYEKAQFVTDILHPFAFIFKSQRQHVIAVRYSNFTAAELNKQRETPFVQFEINIEKVNDLIPDLPLVVNFILELGCLASILLTLGLVHLILFLFYKEKKQNLYYSIYSLVLSLLIFALALLFTSRNFELARFSTAFMVYTLPIIPIALIALLYDIFYKRMLKFFWVLLVISAVYMAFHFYRNGSDKAIGAIIFFVSVVEIYRIIIKAIAKKKEGAAIFGIGFLYIPFFFLTIMGIVVVTRLSESHDFSNYFTNRLSPIMLFLSLISVSISMTIYLARDFARANKKLKVQITEISELSERTMQHETEKKRILENQNIELEKKVAERTAEVVQQKDVLENTLQNLKSTQDQLVQSEKMASLGQLTAGVAHEINNPINFVSANITPLKRDIDEIMLLLEKYADLDQNNFQNKLAEILKFKKDIDLAYTINEIKSLLKGIEEGSKRTAEIVKGLRNFSRLDEEEMKKTNINEGIESTLVLLRNKLTHSNIELIKSLDTFPEIEGYPGQLNQVFMNIITNAIDSFGENISEKNERKIFITTTKENDQIKISIRDTGKGMNEEVKKKIFDPFFTTKDVGKGTGLGLSISYGIIEKHEGKIEVMSEKRKGSEFVITLPS